MDLDIDALLDSLTLEEKASLTSGSSFWHTTAIERLGIPRVMLADGPHGIRAQPADGDHLGLGGSIPATCFPTASAVASSWNPQLMRRIGEALAREARAAGVSVVLGPGVNMKRSPLCGRNFEYLSEDPFLAGELGVGIVDGIQSGGVGTSVKHYAANNQETERFRVDVQVDERTLREIYLPAFERIVRTCRPWTVMCSYNKVNGTSASENSWLLDDVLREEWGFDGLVLSDWGAVYHRVPALAAGLDLEMPPNLPHSPDGIVAAVRTGQLAEHTLDRSVRRVLDLVARATAVLDGVEVLDEGTVAAHHALARTAAAESVILLRNGTAADGTPLLPLPPTARVAVVGEFARTPRFQGAGSSQVNPTRVENALDELRAVLDDVTFAPGYVISGSHGGDADTAAALRAEAAASAADADRVVVFLGLPGADESEGYDRTHLDLPADQLATLAAVAAANPQVVVVLVNGSVVELGRVLPHAGALVEAWLGGQAAGGALADVLTGRVNPSGRLAETVPHRLSDTPSYLNFPGDSQVVRYGEGVFIGYRGHDATDTDVAFPFGYGLSYTTFALSRLQVAVSGSVAADDLSATVRATVTNTGPVEGAEVVQVYVRDVEATVRRPVRELRGFTRTVLGPGESREVEIVLDQRAFSFWSERLGRWVVEAGEFVIEVGPHSRCLPLARTVDVAAPPTTAPLTADSSLREWLADTHGRALLAEAAATGQPDPTQNVELLPLVGDMPMSSLTAFPGLSVDRDALTGLTRHLPTIPTTTCED